ncbi:hypothetical protein FB480_1132 [Agrobacterium vitis]|nr:hypothetical protein FB480_1132 [Agrobacterium vitis]
MMNLNMTLPQRPLTIKRGVLSLPFVYYFSPPIILALLVAIFYMEGPGIARDLQIKQAPLELQDGDINGSCRTKKAIFTSCEAKLTYTYDGVKHVAETDFMFVDLHTGDYEASIVISKTDPQLATLSLGLSMLWNRIISFLAFGFLLAAGLVVLLLTLFRILRSRGTIRQPGLLSLIPVAITASSESRGRLSLTYADIVREDKTKRMAFTQLEKDAEPIVIGESKGHAVALAVWHEHASVPVLLDSRMERINLEREERADLLRSLSDQGAIGEHSEIDPQAKSQSFLQSVKVFVAAVLLLLVALFGYWLWYVFAAPSQFTSPAMDINNIMPGPLNRWACGHLQARFGDQNAPFGCVADDFKSWK